MKPTSQMWFHKPLRKSPAFGLLTCRLSFLTSIHTCLFCNQQIFSMGRWMLYLLLAAGALPAYPWPVQTLESAKCCLGIDADQYITQYVICPQCWKHYTSKQVSEFDSLACLVGDCKGILFDEVLDGKGRHKWQPKKVNPYTSIINTLQCFFMWPGFAKMIKDSWGHGGSHNDDEDFVMRNIYDGAVRG